MPGHGRPLSLFIYLVMWRCHTVVVVGVHSGCWGSRVMVVGGSGDTCAYEGGRKGSNRLEKLPVLEYQQVTCWFSVARISDPIPSLYHLLSIT